MTISSPQPQRRRMTRAELMLHYVKIVGIIAQLESRIAAKRRDPSVQIWKDGAAIGHPLSVEEARAELDRAGAEALKVFDLLMGSGLAQAAQRQPKPESPPG